MVRVWEPSRFPVNDPRAISRYWQNMAAIPDDEPGAVILREMALNRLEALRLTHVNGATGRLSRP